MGEHVHNEHKVARNVSFLLVPALRKHNLLPGLNASLEGDLDGLRTITAIKPQQQVSPLISLDHDTLCNDPEK